MPTRRIRSGLTALARPVVFMVAILILLVAALVAFIVREVRFNAACAHRGGQVVVTSTVHAECIAPDGRVIGWR